MADPKPVDASFRRRTLGSTLAFAVTALVAVINAAGAARAQDAPVSRPAPATAGEMLVFVGSRVPASRDGIRVLAFDPQAPSFREVAAIRGVASPTYLAVVPERRRIFTVSEVARHSGVREGEIVAFDFDRETSAATVAWRRRSGGNGPCHIAVLRGSGGRDESPLTLGVAHYGDGATTVLQDDGNSSTPVLRPQTTRAAGLPLFQTGPVRERQEAPHAHFVGRAPGDDRFVFWCDLGADRVHLGSLTPDAPASEGIALPPGSGPRHAVVDGDRLYVVCELSSTIETLRAASGGLLQRLPERITSTLPPGVAAAGNFPAAIKLSPDRRRLYVSNRGADLLATFDLGLPKDEAPTESRPGLGPWKAVSFVPAGGAWPWDLEPSPDGRFLFVANTKSDELVAFAIDPASGAPTTIVARIAVEKPTCVVASGPSIETASQPSSRPTR